MQIQLLIRGICCCVPGIPGQSENITIRRIEVCFPLYDQKLKTEILELIRLQLADNVAATPVTAAGENIAIDPMPGERPVPADPVRSQEAIYRYLTSIR